MPATMPPPKKKKPNGKNRHAMLLRLDSATAAALESFISSQPVPPKRNPVIVSALRQFLAQHGYWPPKS